MPTTTLTPMCRTMTTFDAYGKIDEEAQRQYLQRFVDTKTDIFVASSGSGSGQSLNHDELLHLYEIGTAVGKGAITVAANVPEQFTAQLSLEQTELAIKGGVDLVNLYGPDGRHGFKATDAEYLTYFDYICSATKHRLSICPNGAIGYEPKAVVVAAICNKYPQIERVVLAGQSADQYLVDLQDALSRDVDIFVSIAASPSALAMGVSGITGSEPNLLPQTIRRYLDSYAAGDREKQIAAYREIRRLGKFNSQWPNGGVRTIMMYLKTFKLPGGEGRLPGPYVHYSDADYEKFAAGVVKLNIPEINDLARAAGLSVPS